MKNFWNGRKVLITGHTGFKGSWLTLYLKLLGAQVYGYALKPENKSLYNLLKLKEDLVISRFGDIRNKKKLNLFCQQVNPSVIIHLAAQPLVLEAYKNPIYTLETNINSTINLIDIASKTRSVKILLNVTTDKVYQTSKKLKLNKENSPLKGSEIYSVSKVCSDMITEIYSNSFNSNKKYLVARSGNVIGGGDFSKNRIIPDILDALNNRKILKIRNKSHIRPWQHVLDPLSGYLLLIEKLFFKNKLAEDEISWNFGPKKSSYISVQNLLNKINKDKEIKISYLKENKFYEAKHVGLDYSKSQKKIGWSPNLNINQTIENILSWNKAHIKKSNLKEYSIAQILDYQKKSRI